MIDFGLSKDYSEKQVMQTPSGSVSLILFTFSPTTLPLKFFSKITLISVISGPLE